MIITVRGIPIDVSSASIAASLRIDDMAGEADRRARALAPGGYWTAALAIPDVKFEARMREVERRLAVLEGGNPPAVEPYAIGTMDYARAIAAIEAGAAIQDALNAAVIQVMTILQGAGTEAEKVAAIDAVSPAWPAT